MRLLLGSLVCFLLVATSVHAATPAEWSSRTIYQIITDRFAQGNSTSTQGCDNWKGYCGGTFDGIIAHLDYILDMGFDAIWISPVVANIGDAYHGYAAQNLYEINPHFGGADGLHALIQAAHNKNMYVMVDVVANHMGIPNNYDFSQLTPFNQAYHYHSCDSCPQYCNINDWNNQNQVETCRLDGLPDLNQTVGYVHDTLVSWVHDLVANYSIDGLRIDTIPEVSKSFWPDFQNGAGVYAVGEVFNGDINYVAPYSYDVDAVLSYPLYFTLRNCFQQQQSLRQLESSTQTYPQHFRDINVLGTFVDNHDNPRFLNSQGDYQLYKAALTYVLMSTGIPIIYYGTEQGFHGGSDPNCREPLWTTSFSHSNSLYAHLQTVINFRKEYKIWQEKQIQRYADDQFYAFTRGDTLVLLTNVGQNGSPIVRNITYMSWSEGTRLCSVFYSNDCITVQDSVLSIYLQKGETKIYHVQNRAPFSEY